MGFPFLSLLLQSVSSLLIFSCVIIPVLIYRLIVSILAKIVNPRNVVEITGPRTAIVGASPSNCFESSVGNVVVASLFNRIHYSQLLQTITQFSQCDQKLKCYGERHFGFDFWIKDKSFETDNHLVYVEGLGGDQITLRPISAFNPHIEQPGMALEDYATLQKLLLRDIPPAKQSPWKVILVPNVLLTDGSSSSALILRYHHSLGDGHSLLKSLVGINGPESTLTRANGLLDKVWIWVLAVLDIHAMAFPAPLPPHPIGVLCRPPTELSGVEGALMTRSPRVDVATIRRIKARWEVPFAAVTLYGVTSAIRSFYLKMGEVPPTSFMCLYVLPAPNHPGGLSNHWTFALLHLPTGEVDGVTRLKKTRDVLQNSVKEAAIRFHQMTILGKLLRDWQPPRDGQPWPMTYSDFPGPQTPIQALGGEINDIAFNANYLTGSQGLQLHGLTYAGTWSVSAIMDEGITKSQQEADHFLAMVTECIHELEYL